MTAASNTGPKEVSRSVFLDAIAGAMTLHHGQHAAVLMESLPKGDALTIIEAGRIVAAVLAEYPAAHAFEAIDQMTLCGANVTLNGEVAWLDPEAVLSHPALKGWATFTLKEQMAAVMQAGGYLAGIAVTTPIFEFVSAIQVGTELRSVVVDLSFPASGGYVSLNFGRRVVAEHHRVVRELSGDALMGIGLEILREAPINHTAAISAPDGEQASNERTVH